MKVSDRFLSSVQKCRILLDNVTSRLHSRASCSVKLSLQSVIAMIVLIGVESEQRFKCDTTRYL
jgi:hypothetical protein